MIIIIDYDAGNLRSVETALAHLGADFATSSDPGDVLRAEKVIFPGVGQAAHAMATLRKRGLDQAIIERAQGGRPVLGICVGCQLMLEHADEGNTPCLGLAAGRVRSLATDFPAHSSQAASPRLKVPHIGWNQVTPTDHPLATRLFGGIPQGSSFYFVHSYYPQPRDNSLVLGWTDYGFSFPSVFGRAGLIACQFHPEKSGAAGLKMLENFITLF